MSTPEAVAGVTKADLRWLARVFVKGTSQFRGRRAALALERVS